MTTYSSICPTASIFLDHDWRFVYANPAALTATDTKEDDLLGAVIWSVFPDYDPATRHALEAGITRGATTRILVSHEDGRWSELTAFPVEEGLAVLSRDMTERKQAQEDRDQLLAEEQALNEELAAANEELASQTEELVSQTEELVERERDLRASNVRLELLAGIVENSSQPIGVGFADGSLGFFNRAYCDLLGYTEHELRALDWAVQLTPSEWRSVEADDLAELHSTGKPVTYEKEYLHKDGSRIPVQLLVHLARDAGGSPLYYFSFITDLTERKRAEAERDQLLAEEHALNEELAATNEELVAQAERLLRREEALKESRSRFRGLFEALSEAGALCELIRDRDGSVSDYRLLDVNTAFLLMTGLSREAAVGRRAKHLFGEVSPVAFETFAEVGLTGRPDRFESHNKLLGKWFETSVYPQGRSQVFFLAADITERRRIEEELRLSEERFRRALKNTPVSLAAMDKDLRYVWAYNQRTASPEDVVGKTVYDLFPAEAPYLESLQQRVVQTGTDVHEGIWVTRPQGRIFLDLHMEPMRDAAGGIIGIWITSVDLTAQKLAEQTLQTQADLLAKVQDPMVGTDEDLVINYWNQAAERTYGWKAAEVVGRPVTEVLGAHVPGPYRDEAIEQLLSAGSFRDESVVVRKNGAQIWVEAQTSLLGRPDGTMSGTISAQRDVSERKRAEEELRKSGERSRLFLTVADAVAEWTDLDKVLDASLEAIVGATAHSRASIGLWDPKSRRIQVMASAGAQPMGPASAPLEAFSHSMREAISTGKTVLVDYDRLPPEERQIADSYRTHDALLVPLVYHAQVTGVVLVDDPGEKSSFSDEERDLIEGIASQAAVAIENARLYEAQRNIAEQLQLAILDMPRSVSGLEFAHLYRSATEEAIVGGDFYDVFERNDGSIILLAGDVSGHGVNAARVATMVKASLVAFAQGGDPPGKVLINANQLLMRKRVPGFTSVLLATYDPSSGWLQYCSAGHPNLLVGHRDGTVEIVGTNHSPLGVFPEWSCSVDAVQVLPGDTLLLYTDGLTEARLDGRFFGEARLARVFGARLGTDLQRLPEALLDEALAFSGGRLQDDVAILAVRPVER